MSFADKFNKGGIDWGIDNKDFPFKKREDLLKENGEDKIYTVHGVYINSKGKFGSHPVAISDGYNIDMPSYMTDTVNEILSDVDAVSDIKAGKVGIKLEPFVDKTYGKECVGVTWVDLVEA